MPVGTVLGLSYPRTDINRGQSRPDGPPHHGVGTLHEGMLPEVPLLPALWPQVVVLERTWPPLLNWEAEA